LPDGFQRGVAKRLARSGNADRAGWSPWREGCGLLVILGALSGPTALARPGVFPGLPDAIVCSVRDPTGVLPWDELVFYPSARTIDGNALYKTLTSDPVVLIVGADGILSAKNLADCDGRSIDALRESGRARDFMTP
jgi:hypothetical protein